MRLREKRKKKEKEERAKWIYTALQNTCDFLENSVEAFCNIWDFSVFEVFLITLNLLTAQMFKKQKKQKKNKTNTQKIK